MEACTGAAIIAKATEINSDCAAAFSGREEELDDLCAAKKKTLDADASRPYSQVMRMSDAELEIHYDGQGPWNVETDSEVVAGVSETKNVVAFGHALCSVPQKNKTRFRPRH